MRPRDRGIEFLVGVGGGAGVFSAAHSSLWSAQNFGTNPATADSARSYAWLATWATIAFTGLGSLLEKTIWPLLGGATFSAFMLFGYRRSLNRAAGKDSGGGELVDTGPQPARPRPPRGSR